MEGHLSLLQDKKELKEEIKYSPEGNKEDLRDYQEDNKDNPEGNPGVRTDSKERKKDFQEGKEILLTTNQLIIIPLLIEDPFV